MEETVPAAKKYSAHDPGVSFQVDEKQRRDAEVPTLVTGR
jgi:hypothetical protein